MTVLGTKYWDGLVFTAAALFGLFVAFQVLGLWAKHVYRNKWLGGDHASQLDVDAFVDNEVNREPPNHLKVVFMHKSATSGRTPIDNTIKLSSVESDHVKGCVSLSDSTHGKAVIVRTCPSRTGPSPLI